VYGIDLGDHELLHARSWRWLQIRTVGLLSTECRLTRKLFPPQNQNKTAPTTERS